MILEHSGSLAQSGEVPPSAETEHRNVASRRSTSTKRMGLVAQTFSKALWVDVLHEDFDSCGSPYASHSRTATRDAVELINSKQAAGLRWIAWRTNGNNIFIVSINLSLNTGAVKA